MPVSERTPNQLCDAEADDQRRQRHLHRPAADAERAADGGQRRQVEVGRDRRLDAEQQRQREDDGGGGHRAAGEGGRAAGRGNRHRRRLAVRAGRRGHGGTGRARRPHHRSGRTILVRARRAGRAHAPAGERHERIRRRAARSAAGLAGDPRHRDAVDCNPHRLAVCRRRLVRPITAKAGPPASAQAAERRATWVARHVGRVFLAEPQRVAFGRAVAALVEPGSIRPASEPTARSAMVERVPLPVPDSSLYPALGQRLPLLPAVASRPGRCDSLRIPAGQKRASEFPTASSWPFWRDEQKNRSANPAASHRSLRKQCRLGQRVDRDDTAGRKLLEFWRSAGQRLPFKPGPQ